LACNDNYFSLSNIHHTAIKVGIPVWQSPNQMSTDKWATSKSTQLSTKQTVPSA